MTLLINGGGQLSANPRANVYATSQSVTLTAYPDSGQTFLNWSGDASGTQNPLTIAMTQRKVITANFSSAPVLRVNQGALDGLSSGGFRFSLLSVPQTAWQIFCSTNFNGWQLIGTVTNTQGEVQFTDSGATNQSRRFYKAVGQ